MQTALSRVAASLAAGGGSVLSGAARLLAARPAARPLHPKGTVVLAQLRRHGANPPTGVPWLDDHGVDQVLVRRSRAIGLPGALPDVHGLSLRVPLGADRYGDLLFAMTGLGPIGRFVLTGSRSGTGRPFTTLLPYATPTEPILLAAVPRDEDRFELACARSTGSWRPFADLVLSAEEGPDPLISFDPLLNPVPGLDNYGWVRRLREPAYRAARTSRRKD